MVIHQRRAYERIIFEKLVRSQMERQPLAQQSLFPETVKLNAEDYQVCLEMLEELEQLGFDIRDFGNQSVVIHGIPTDLNVTGNSAVDTLEIIIEQYKSLQGEIELGFAEKIAHSAARTSASGYRQQLTEPEMQELTDQLFSCSNPNHTPSGKLIVRIIEMGELEKQFKE